MIFCSGTDCRSSGETPRESENPMPFNESIGDENLADKIQAKLASIKGAHILY